MGAEYWLPAVPYFPSYGSILRKTVFHADMQLLVMIRTNST